MVLIIPNFPVNIFVQSFSGYDFITGFVPFTPSESEKYQRIMGRDQRKKFRAVKKIFALAFAFVRRERT